MQESLAYPQEFLTPVVLREAMVPECSTKSLPPYNGYGSLADSAENCKHLIPKPPKKDFYKLINNSTIVLRFGARFLHDATHPVSEEHRHDLPAAPSVPLLAIETEEYDCILGSYAAGQGCLCLVQVLALRYVKRRCICSMQQQSC